MTAFLAPFLKNFREKPSFAKLSKLNIRNFAMKKVFLSLFVLVIFAFLINPSFAQRPSLEDVFLALTGEALIVGEVVGES